MNQMEKNENKEETMPNFKTVQNPNTYKTIYKNERTTKSKSRIWKKCYLTFL